MACCLHLGRSGGSGVEDLKAEVEPIARGACVAAQQMKDCFTTKMRSLNPSALWEEK